MTATATLLQESVNMTCKLVRDPTGRNRELVYNTVNRRE
jgi:hypothetical protein